MKVIGLYSRLNFAPIPITVFTAKGSSRANFRALNFYYIFEVYDRNFKPIMSLVEQISSVSGIQI